MIVNKLLNYTSSKYSEGKDHGDIQEIDKDLISLFACLSGGVRFGAGNHLSKGENIQGMWYTYTSNATPDTEDTLTHNINAVPVGYLVVKQNKAGSLYAGSSAWTTTKMYLKCSVASVQFTIFIIF